MSSTNDTPIETLKTQADAGDAQAQFEIGKFFQVGGVTQDYAQARIYYKKASEQNHIDAILRLGNMYEEGEGMDKNIAKAVECYTKAAALGCVEAKETVQLIYDDLSNSVGKAILDFAKAAQDPLFENKLAAMRVILFHYSNEAEKAKLGAPKAEPSGA